MLVITNATLFDGRRLLPGRHSVTVDGNTIAAIDDPSTVTAPLAETEVIDAAGMTVLPGLITSHLHALGTACSTNNETKINAALDAQGDMWSEINVLVARLVQTFPVLLDSDWQPLPMPVKELKAARDTKDFQENDT